MSYNPSLIPAIPAQSELINAAEAPVLPKHLPISANLTPRSAPLSPRPRKGNITPGVSKEYTSGSCDSFNRVERALVSPGWAEVRRALGVAVYIRIIFISSYRRQMSRKTHDRGYRRPSGHSRVWTCRRWAYQRQVHLVQVYACIFEQHLFVPGG